MFALDPFIFVFGGQCKKEKVCSQVVYCYDTLAHAWTTAHPAGRERTTDNRPEARDMATMSVCGHSAFLFGGYNQKCFDDVYLLRLTTAANRALETLILPEDLPSSPPTSPPSPTPSSSSSSYPIASSSSSSLSSSYGWQRERGDEDEREWTHIYQK